MKKYIRKKEILAQPIGYIEFQQYIGIEQYIDIDSEAMVNKPGYMIESRDGLLFWKSKEDFERSYKPSETFLDRLIVEHSELEEKYKMLSAFIDGNKAFSGLDKIEKDDLAHQQVIMKEYLMVLNARIERAKQNA